MEAAGHADSSRVAIAEATDAIDQVISAYSMVSDVIDNLAISWYQQ